MISFNLEYYTSTIICLRVWMVIHMTQKKKKNNNPVIIFKNV